MKRLHRTEIARLLHKVETLAVPGNGEAWAKWCDEQGDKPARLEMPLGEIMNPAIAGFVWAWHALDRIKLGEIKKGTSFNAQGLEGKMSIDTDLNVALIVWRESPAYRCNIFVGVKMATDELQSRPAPA